MSDEDLLKVVNFIEGYYNRTLKETEIISLSEELKNCCNSYDDFINKFKFPLLKKVEYFTVAHLHRLIQEDNELEAFKRHLGIQSFEELYEN